MANVKKWIGKIVVLGCCLLVVLWVVEDTSTEPSSVEPDLIVPTVTVITVNPMNANVAVEAIGVSLVRWPVDIISSVSGRVELIQHATEPGNTVEKGAPLLNIQATLYKAEVEVAHARIAEAELELARLKHEQFVVRKISNGNPLTSFGSFEPHIQAAESEVRAAKASFLYAEQQLTDTKVVSPFAALILETYVTPGQWINQGDVLFRLAYRDAIDVRVELSASQWQRVAGMKKGSMVKVVTPDGKPWEGFVRYLSPTLDTTTRQRSIVLQINDPYLSEAPLLSDQQVNVIFNGPLLNNVVRAPASVVTEDGRVWSIVNDTLHQEQVELIDEQPTQVKFRYRVDPAQSRMLVRYPLSTMLEGQKAKPELMLHGKDGK